MPQITNKELMVFNPNITKDRAGGNAFIITDGSNIIPTYNGYASGLGTEPLFFFPSSNNLLKKVVDLQDDVGQLVITGNVLYRYYKESGEGSILYTTGSEITNFTVAYIGTYYYILLNGLLFKYDHLNNKIEQITPNGFPNNANYLIATNNRLLTITDDTVAWTAVGNGDDWTPSTTTGAGFQSLDSLSTGKGVALAAKKNGFVIFTTDNIISVTELNSALLFNFKEVSKMKLFNANTVVTSPSGVIFFIDSDRNLYSYTDVNSLGSGGFSPVSEELVDYFRRINANITALDLIDSRYLVINYPRNLIGLDLLLGRLFKVQHDKNVFGFYFIQDSHLNRFSYHSVTNTEYADISYFGNQLKVESTEDIMCASMTMFSDLPIADGVIRHQVDVTEPEFTNFTVPTPTMFSLDLEQDFIDVDLENAPDVDIDLELFNNTFGSSTEMSASIEVEKSVVATKINPVSSFMEFGTLHMSPELPIDCATILTNVDTNLTSKQEEFVFDCVLEGELLLDCQLVNSPDYTYNKIISDSFDIQLFVNSTSDGYRETKTKEVTDKYFVGKRMKGNIYTTGIYHVLRYLINGFCEITGIQINLTKGGKIYERLNKK